jgi:hypothetical protein
MATRKKSCYKGQKPMNTESVYSIDSFPIPVCDNIRIPRSKIYDGNEEYRGYQASKKRYFYGVKIHLMVTASREPVEFFLTSGSFADVRGLRVFPFDLPEGSVVYRKNGFKKPCFQHSFILIVSSN